MVWFKVDDHFHSHRKAKRSGLEAVGLWCVAGSYCAAHLTDGFVEEWYVNEWRRGPRLAAVLVGMGLWSEATRDGERGWQFHDWDKHQPTKTQVEAERKKARDRKAAQRLSQGDNKRDTPKDDPRDYAQESQETPVPYPPAQPARPSLSLVSSGGDITQGDDPEPPRFCPNHPHGTQLNCGDCKDARIAHEAWTKRDEARKKAIRDQYRELSQNCPICHGTNVIDVGENEVRKCDHEQARHA